MNRLCKDSPKNVIKRHLLLNFIGTAVQQTPCKAVLSG